MTAARAGRRSLVLVPFFFPLILLSALAAVLAGAQLCARPEVAAGDRTAGPDSRPAAKAVFRLALFASGLSEPVHLVAPPGDAERVFVAEKTGRVRIIRGGKLCAAPFADFSSRVSRGSEQGLLSLAFHPKYAENGRVFFSFTDRKGDTRIVERRASRENPDCVDSDFEREILFVDQPYPNHNGGLVLFGPDGKLWIGLGDGGSGGDPHGNGQRLDTLLGKLLRIDVDVPEPRGAPYAIPPDNPFAGHAGARPEIWASGLRNPWRFSFDRETGDLYIADVGQNLWEEVDVAPAGSKGGENYGWNIMEGFHAFRPWPGARPPLVAPVVEYGHDVGLSITGGAVYRGKEIPEIRGAYFYADYATGVIRSFRWEKGAAKDAIDWTKVANPGRISQWTSFGEDARGEIYLLSQEGEIYRFEPALR
jgi:glucose/arabinose dehydrogenase